MKRDEAETIQLPVRVALYACDRCGLESPSEPISLAPGRAEHHDARFIAVETARPRAWGDVHIPHMNRRVDLCPDCLKHYQAAIEVALRR